MLEEVGDNFVWNVLCMPLHSPNRYLLSTYYILDAVLAPKDSAMSRTEKIIFFMLITS